MSGRVHDQKCFYKYASFETAIRVIESKSFRWSSPIKFNDPFDNQAGFVHDINADELYELLINSVERVIFGDCPISEEGLPIFTNSLSLIRNKASQSRKAEFIEQIRNTKAVEKDKVNEGMDLLNSRIRDHLARSRVLCVSERSDNVVMWSHYADEHRGVVFQLGCIDALDNRLLAAKKVTYSESFISFPNTGDYARHLTGEQPIDIIRLVWEIAFTKHLDWSNELEWRVHIPWLDQPVGDGFSILEEPKEVFEAVYLGCRMDPNKREAILQVIRHNLPNTKIFLAEQSSTSFSLKFREIE
jgi:Protein of unknown function (DUF2971)